MPERAHKLERSVSVDGARGRKNFVFAFWYFYFAPYARRLANGLS